MPTAMLMAVKSRLPARSLVGHIKTKIAGGDVRESEHSSGHRDASSVVLKATYGTAVSLVKTLCSLFLMLKTHLRVPDVEIERVEPTVTVGRIHLLQLLDKALRGGHHAFEVVHAVLQHSEVLPTDYVIPEILSRRVAAGNGLTQAIRSVSQWLYTRVSGISFRFVLFFLCSPSSSGLPSSYPVYNAIFWQKRGGSRACFVYLHRWGNLRGFRK